MRGSRSRSDDGRRVVQPRTSLVSLVPQNEPLLAEVQIENQDIGFVKVGQPVRLKVMAYRFQKYGMLEGKIRTVSADSSSLRSARAAAGRVPSAPTLNFKAIFELRDQRLLAGDLALPLACGHAAVGGDPAGRANGPQILVVAGAAGGFRSGNGTVV